MPKPASTDLKGYHAEGGRKVTARRNSGHSSGLSGDSGKGQSIDDAAQKPRLKYAADDASIVRHKYDKLAMLKVYAQNKEYCDTRPFYLDTKFNNPENCIWNPELWINFLLGRDPTQVPPVNSSSDRQRQPNNPGQSAVGAHRTGQNNGHQPIDRLKVENNGDVVLSPQRRSFGAGCQLNKQKEFFNVKGHHRVEQAGRGRGGSATGSGARNGGAFGGRGGKAGEQRWRRSSRTYEKGTWYEQKERRDEPEWMEGGPEDFQDNMELHGFEDDTANATRSETPVRSTKESGSSMGKGAAATNDSSCVAPSAPEVSPSDGLLFEANSMGGFTFSEFLDTANANSSKFKKFFTPSTNETPVVTTCGEQLPVNGLITACDGNATRQSLERETASAPANSDIINILSKMQSVAPGKQGRDLAVSSAGSETKMAQPVTNLAELEARLLQQNMAGGKADSVQQSRPRSRNGGTPVLKDLIFNSGTGDGPKMPQNALTEAELLARMKCSQGPGPGHVPMAEFAPASATQGATAAYHQQQEKLRESMLRAQQAQQCFPLPVSTPSLEQSTQVAAAYLAQMGVCQGAYASDTAEKGGGLLKAAPSFGITTSGGPTLLQQQAAYMPKLNHNNFNFTPTSVLKQLHKPGLAAGGVSTTSGNSRPIVKNSGGSTGAGGQEAPNESGKEDLARIMDGGFMPSMPGALHPSHQVRQQVPHGVSSGGGPAVGPSLIDIQKMFQVQQARFLEQLRASTPTGSLSMSMLKPSGMRLDHPITQAGSAGLAGIQQSHSSAGGHYSVAPPHVSQHQGSMMGASSASGGMSGASFAHPSVQQQMFMQALAAKQMQANVVSQTSVLEGTGRAIHGTGHLAGPGGTGHGAGPRGNMNPELWQLMHQQQAGSALTPSGPGPRGPQHGGRPLSGGHATVGGMAGDVVE